MPALESLPVGEMKKSAVEAAVTVKVGIEVVSAAALKVALMARGVASSVLGVTLAV